MSLVSRQILRDPGLSAALDSGEQAREYVSLKPMVQGARRDVAAGAAVAKPRRGSAGREVAGFFAGNWLPRWARGDAMERMLGGVARQGVPGSIGARLRDAADGASGLVVTDRRLLVVQQGPGETVEDPEHPGRRRTSTPFDARFAVDLTELTSVRRRGRLVGRGRVELTFADASMCAVVVGVLRTEGARRLLAALDAGGEGRSG